MKKPKLYTGGDLRGECLFTRKIDGVRMLRNEEGKPVSRAGKPLYNLDHITPHITDAEVYLGTWEDSVSAVRTMDSAPVPEEHIYSLDPIDPRLIIDTLLNPPQHVIESHMRLAILNGDEGLVIYTDDRAYKVKPKDNWDVKVLGATEGKGKYSGMIGALITERGNVSGFTNEQRLQFTNELPSVIEVEAMGLTKNGKFRHPRFVRERFDKEG